MDPHQIRLIILLTIFVVMFVLENIIPARTWHTSRPKRLGFHLGISIFNTILMRLTIVAPLLMLVIWANSASFGLRHLLGLEGWLELAVTFVLYDFVDYWWHRANHVIPFFWRFHRAHHSDTHVDVTTTLRFHPGELLLSGGLKAIFICAWGPSLEGYTIALTGITVFALFHHANIRLSLKAEKFVRLFYMTPRLHTGHHTRSIRTRDANFSTIFLIWDRLFRTLREPDELEMQELGLNEARERELSFVSLIKTPVVFALFLILILASSPLQANEDRTLYQMHCARCHGDEGKGDGPAHTMQRPWPRDFTTGIYKFRSTPKDTLPTSEDVAHVIREGILRTSMPPFKKFLSEAEIERLAQYVLSLSKSGLPDGTPQAIPHPRDLDQAATSELISQGKALFAKHRCALCHGDDARGLGQLAGGMYTKDGFWTNPVDLTDPLTYGGGNQASDIYMRLAVGLGDSPMLDYSQIPDEEMRAIALFVKSLQISPTERTLISQEVWQAKLPARARGEYLTRAMTCSLCHNSYNAAGFYNPDLYLAGGVGIHLPGLGTFPTRNITSHPEYGIGNWTEEEIVRVMTTGHAPDRRIEAFAMPWVFFSHLEEQDAKDIATYVKTLPPIANEVPDRTWQPFWLRLWERIKQLIGLEKGRLEYPYYNVGTVHEEVS